MNNIISLRGDPIPTHEAPMVEMVEPIREPITIRIKLPDPPAPTRTPFGIVVGQVALGFLLGFLVVWAVLS